MVEKINKTCEKQQDSYWVCSFGMIQKGSMMRDHFDHGTSKEPANPLRVDWPVPLMHHDLTDPGSLILFWIVQEPYCSTLRRIRKKSRLILHKEKEEKKRIYLVLQARELSSWKMAVL